jgi:hypothetical protein
VHALSVALQEPSSEDGTSPRSAQRWRSSSGTSDASRDQPSPVLKMMNRIGSEDRFVYQRCGRRGATVMPNFGTPKMGTG